MAITPITLTHARLTAITALTSLQAACSLAPAPGTAMDGAADVGADADGADAGSMADAAVTADAECTQAGALMAAEVTLADPVMADQLAATPAHLAATPEEQGAERHLHRVDIAAAGLAAQSAAADSMVAAVADPTAAAVTGNLVSWAN